MSKELIEMRANITKYGDFNLLNEVRNTENAIDRRRKGERTKKMQNEQKQEKLKRQMKGTYQYLNSFLVAEREEIQKQMTVFAGRKSQNIIWKPKIDKGDKGKEVYDEHEADIMKYIYN